MAKRLITQALEIAETIFAGEEDGAYNPTKAKRLITILRQLDARKSVLEPHLKRGYRPKKRKTA